MDAYQLLEIAVALSNRLDTHWTLFITVHLALIGGIIYVDRPLHKPEKIIAVLVYTGFAVINYLMMINQVQFLNSLYQDILAFQSHVCCKDSKTLEHIALMAGHSAFKNTIWSIAAIHLVMYVLVVISILNDKARTKLKSQPDKDLNDIADEDENSPENNA